MNAEQVFDPVDDGVDDVFFQPSPGFSHRITKTLEETGDDVKTDSLKQSRKIIKSTADTPDDDARYLKYQAHNRCGELSENLSPLDILDDRTDEFSDLSETILYRCPPVMVCNQGNCKIQYTGKRVAQ